MYNDIKKNLDEVEKNPQKGPIGQQQHISVTATLAKINIDLLDEMSKLRKTILDLAVQNDRLRNMTMMLSVVGVILALIQVLPIVLSLFK